MGGVPAEFAQRRQLLRAYGHDRAQVYDLNRVVEPGDLDAAIVDVLADDRVELVQARNMLPGCYSFTATRGWSSTPGAASRRYPRRSNPTRARSLRASASTPCASSPQAAGHLDKLDER